MKQKNYNGEWAGCSNFKERREELQRNHEEFLKMKDMLDRDWEIKKSCVKHSRPRIKQDKFKVIITCFGTMKITIEEYNAHCRDFRTL